MFSDDWVRDRSGGAARRNAAGVVSLAAPDARIIGDGTAANEANASTQWSGKRTCSCSRLARDHTPAASRQPSILPNSCACRQAVPRGVHCNIGTRRCERGPPQRWHDFSVRPKRGWSGRSEGIAAQPWARSGEPDEPRRAAQPAHQPCAKRRGNDATRVQGWLWMRRSKVD